MFSILVIEEKKFRSLLKGNRLPQFTVVLPTYLLKYSVMFLNWLSLDRCFSYTTTGQYGIFLSTYTTSNSFGLTK
jgi:hypothetical protein